jgi:plastocyanin
MRRVVVVLATSLLGAFGLAALLSEPGQAVTTAHISISNFTYSGTFHVQPGETVEVVNNDPMRHTLTDKHTHLFNTGPIPPNGGSRSFTAPSRVGRYPFGCNFHSFMHGTLTVGNPKDVSALTAPASASVTSGAAHKLSTKLTDTTTRHALAAQHVMLQQRTGTAPFTTVATPTTNSSGAATATVHPSRRTQYRWHYAGNARHAAATSKVGTLSIR